MPRRVAGRREGARAAGQEGADDALHLLALEQEGVVAVVALDLVVAHVLVGGAQGADDLLELVRRVQPVAAERQHQEARRHVAEGLHQAPVPAREVEVVEGAGDVEVGVGVEAVGERQPLVAQVALDLEVGREGERVVVDVAQAAAELLLHGLVAQVGDVADHARHAEALGRRLAAVVVAAVPVGVGHDRLAADLVEGDRLRGLAGGGGQGHAEVHALGMRRRPTPAPACRPSSRRRRRAASRCRGGRAASPGR